MYKSLFPYTTWAKQKIDFISCLSTNIMSEIEGQITIEHNSVSSDNKLTLDDLVSEVAKNEKKR
jgi:hypothetical protein